MKILNKVALATILTASSLSAHAFWINSFESFSHKPGHTTVSLGWGHSLPVDDILNSPNGKVLVEEFSIISPSGEKMALTFPKSKNIESTNSNSNFEVFDAQIGLQKIALKKDSQKGTYKIQANTKATFYTGYIDTKDRKRSKLKPLDEIKNIKKVNMSVKYQAFATSYLTIGKWENPKATNKGLEIIPKTDLSNLKVGDLVEVEVLFNGKPLSTGTKGARYITASSNTFGQSHKFSLFSHIIKGKAQFIVQSSGQWMIHCGYQDNVTKDGDLKEMYGKAHYVAQVGTLTFNVK